MSFMDFFKAPSSADNGQPPAPAPAPVPPAPPVPPLPPENPMDAYKAMFENANKSETLMAPEFKLPSETLDKVAGSMNFLQSTDQELMQKALAGDAQSLINVVNAAAQNAYKAAMNHATSLTDTYLQTRGEYESKKVASGVKDTLTAQAIRDIPNANHPVVQQQLAQVAAQFAKANPDSTPQEIAQAAHKYIADLASVLNPQAPQNQQKASDVSDWSAFFKGN